MPGGKVYAVTPKENISAGPLVASRTSQERFETAVLSTTRESASAADARSPGFQPPAFDFRKIPVRRPDSRRSEATAATSHVPAAALPSPRLQAKLEVGAVDDPLEREADEVAERVMQTSTEPRPRVAIADGRSVAAAQRKCTECEDEEKLQRKSEPGAPVGPAPRGVFSVLNSSGSPLDAPTRDFMEQRFGHDFGAVRVHADASAAATAREVGARAYTVGHHVAFADGNYSPATTDGRRLLAHELAHVVQQSGGGSTAETDQTLTRAPASVQRECVASPCPDKAISLDGIFPRSAIAEKCLQDVYRQDHEGNTMGFDKEWTMLTPASKKERQGLDLIAARRYWAWKNGIAGAGTKAQEAIGAVAVAAVLAFVAPSAVAAVAEGTAASGGVAATTEVTIRIAATIAEADQAMLAAEALASEAEIMAEAQLETEMDLFSTLGF